MRYSIEDEATKRIEPQNYLLEIFEWDLIVTAKNRCDFRCEHKLHHKINNAKQISG